MSSRPSSSAAARVLWPVAALLALTGVVALALGMAGSAGRLTGDLVGLSGGEQVEVPATGMSVWARSPQARTEVVCTLGGDALLRPVSDFTIEVAGEQFHETARTPEDLAQGTYPLECTSSGSSTEHQLYAGPYGPGTVPSGILGRSGVTLGLVLLPLALVTGVLAWLAGRRRAAAPSRPDPAAYTLDAQHTASAYSSPYATPSSPTARPGPSGGPPSGQSPSGQSPSAAPPFPAGGPFAGGMPPAPVSTGHDEPGTGADAAPPRGPRYDLPPPS